MIKNTLFARVISGFLISAVLMSAAMALAAGPASFNSDSPSNANISARVSADHSIISVASLAPSADKADMADAASGDLRSILIALPYGTDSFTLSLEDNKDGTIDAPDGLMIMRGRPVVRAVIEGAGTGPLSIRIDHDGNWADDSTTAQSKRLRSSTIDAAFNATLPNTKSAQPGFIGGSYVVIYPPEFADDLAPLLDWKTRKGLRVVAASTAVTGSSLESIKAWLQDGYDNWDYPPEYILIAGDTGDIPAFDYYGNPSDLPFTLLDGDDWLPDAMVGRLPVETSLQAATFAQKIVTYERHPELSGDTEWFTKSIMVAGLNSSTTPPHTVEFCGEQLESIGFDAATEITSGSGYIPPATAARLVDTYLEEGASILVYRGWAAGATGWDPPAFNTGSVGGVENGLMLPVILNFVCSNCDYTAAPPCLGEVFVRQGTPEEPKDGAIAFIGNGEHWSHTRHNDSLAISYFERIVDPEITDLGSLMNAGKMRFMNYFPGMMQAEEFGGLSVEFYFHIYNLMGDPELNFWKSAPASLEVTHQTNISVGETQCELNVVLEDGGTAVADARVGIIQNGVFLGHGLTDASGNVTVQLEQPAAAGSALELTVSGPGFAPYEGVINTGTATVFIGATSAVIDDGVSAGSGNSDGFANPGETLSVLPVFRNSGSAASGTASVSITSITGPATFTDLTSNVAGLAPGAEAQPGTALEIVVDENAQRGDIICCTVDAVTGSSQHDISSFTIVITAPEMLPVSLAPTGSVFVMPGQTTNLALTLTNNSNTATVGGTATLELIDDQYAELSTAAATFGACAADENVASAADFAIEVNEGTAVGTNLSFNLTIETNEGYTSLTTVALVVGEIDLTAPVGPDTYGYYAYDSADYDYPASRPTYSWQEISTLFGGEGTSLFDYGEETEIPDNYDTDVIIDLPFTFQYYGQDYSQIRVSDNGWISFDTSEYFSFYNWTIPSQHGNNAIVAPFWDNLNPQSAPDGPNGIDRDGIYSYHNETTNEFIVEWSRLPHYKEEILGLQTFQVILRNPETYPTTSGDGEMLFMYRDVINNDHLRMYATVGWENADGTDGMQLSYSNINAQGMAPLQAGLAVRVTTEAPLRVPFLVSTFNAKTGSSGIQFNWQTDPDRPVLGWQIYRNSETGRELLNAEPLVASARQFSIPQSGNGQDVSYALEALHPYGATSQAGQTSVAGSSPTQMFLAAAKPNPAPGATTIAFTLARNSHARLCVYDVAGRLVKTLIDGQVTAGEEIQVWDGRNNNGAPVAGGMYFYRLETRDGVLTRKLVLVR